MPFPYSVKDRVIWITGSAKRVGKAVVLELARHGAHVVVHCHTSREEGEATASEARKLGVEALLVQGDQSKADDVRRMAGEIEAKFGHLDGLVNGASTFNDGKFTEISEEDFQAAIAVNLQGPFLCCQAAVPLLRKSPRKPAHIINIIDWAVIRPYPNHAAYHCAKGGLDTLTRALAKELAPDILVNSIAPGPMIPPPDLSDKQREARARETLVGRWGSGDDIAHAARFLLEANFVSGVRLPVDGGQTVAGERGGY